MHSDFIYLFLYIYSTYIPFDLCWPLGKIYLYKQNQDNPSVLSQKSHLGDSTGDIADKAEWQDRIQKGQVVCYSPLEISSVFIIWKEVVTDL